MRRVAIPIQPRRHAIAKQTKQSKPKANKTRQAKSIQQSKQKATKESKQKQPFRPFWPNVSGFSEKVLQIDTELCAFGKRPIARKTLHKANFDHFGLT
jgi:hypothetical protein